MLTRASKNIFLTEDVYINEAIKKGEWRQLIVDSMTVGESKLQMKNNYWTRSGFTLLIIGQI